MRFWSQYRCIKGQGGAFFSCLPLYDLRGYFTHFSYLEYAFYPSNCALKPQNTVFTVCNWPLTPPILSEPHDSRQYLYGRASSTVHLSAQHTRATVFYWLFECPNVFADLGDLQRTAHFDCLSDHACDLCAGANADQLLCHQDLSACGGGCRLRHGAAAGRQAQSFCPGGSGDPDRCYYDVVAGGNKKPHRYVSRAVKQLGENV